MAIKFVGVRRRLRKRTLRKRKQYFGPNGWWWSEVNMSNTFTEIDNSRSTSQILCAGGSFSGDITPASNAEFGDFNNKQLVIRRIVAQLFVSAVFPDADLYPFASMDVAIFKKEQTTIFPVGGTANPDLQFVQCESNGRVLCHERLWVGGVPGLYTPTGDEVPYASVMSTNLVNFDYKPNLPLATEESLQIFLGQNDAELYTDGTDFLVQGFVKLFLQQK